MMLKPLGRVALLAFVSIALVCGLTSCASSTLGYLYVTTSQYGQVASLRLDINTGAIKGVTCNTGNGDQGNCVTSSGGSYATKIVLANSNTLAYVLNTAYNGTPASITLLTLGSGGSVFTTGQSYVSYGQNPVDMYLSPTGGFLYVLDQYQPADVLGCSTPTPTTCMGDITVFSIDGKGDLVPVQCQSGDGCINNPGGSSNDQLVFPINYEPGPLNSGYGGSRMLAINGSFFVLDESTPDTSSTSLGTPEINFLTIRSGGDLYPTPGATPLRPGGAVQLSSIILGTHIYVSDYQTGQVWIYLTTQGSSAIGVVCPSQPAGVTSNCAVNSNSHGASTAVQIDAMVASGAYLYIADYNTGTIYTMQDTDTGPSYLTPTGDGYTTLGTNTTCLTLSSSPEFLYASGQGVVVGEQVNTSTGALSTNLHPTTGIPFTQAAPCLVFSPRT